MTTLREVNFFCIEITVLEVSKGVIIRIGGSLLLGWIKCICWLIIDLVACWSNWIWNLASWAFCTLILGCNILITNAIWLLCNGFSLRSQSRILYTISLCKIWNITETTLFAGTINVPYLIWRASYCSCRSWWCYWCWWNIYWCWSNTRIIVSLSFTHILGSIGLLTLWATNARTIE